ncbi:MAG: hypothetical protein PVH19_02515 [Planctomycetia bacterium]|jgi:hypothetical protein
MTTTYETDQLAELVTTKLKCLIELREMGVRQQKCIEDEKMSDLIKVLGAKQTLINRLGQIERAMDPFRTDDPESRVWRSPENRAECRKNVEECDAILAQILEGERQSESILRVRRDETAEKLQSSYASSVTRTAYAEAQPRATSQIDFTE